MNMKKMTLLLSLVVLMTAFLTACQPGDPETTVNEVVQPETNNSAGPSMADRIEFQDLVFDSYTSGVITVEENEMANRIEFHDRIWEQSQLTNQIVPEETTEMTMTDRQLFHDSLMEERPSGVTQMTMAERIQFQDKLEGNQ